MAKETVKITSINVRVDDDIKARVAALADFRGITISQLVREWFLDNIEKEEELVAKILEQERENS